MKKVKFKLKTEEGEDEEIELDLEDKDAALIYAIRELITKQEHIRLS